MTSPPGETQSCNRADGGLTVEQLAAAKRLPVELFTGAGIEDIPYYKRAPAVRIPYADVDGETAAVRFRTALRASDGSTWRRGDKPCLFGLEHLGDARAADYVVLVEGETDALTLRHHGIPALGAPGAGSWREDRDAQLLEEISTIYVVIETGGDGEPDSGGRTVERWLERSAIRHRARLLSVAGGDVSALYLLDPAQFPERMRAALDAAEPWSAVAAARAETAAAEALERCGELAYAPDILDAVSRALEASGLVGEEKAAKIVYLAVVSRLLDRPVNVAIKGPSSGGKSYLVEQVLALFPPSAYHALTAMSERALVYSEEPLAHRVLVLYEAAGMGGDTASYLLRSLLSEGCVRYETVEKTREGLRPRLIEREGPTGLIVTTTAVSLHPENETRLLSLTVDDTSQQTESVLASWGRAARGDVLDTTPDHDRFHALATWLEHGPGGVVIPYAEDLAIKVPPVAVRLRRDFLAVLGLISAHALLHRATRERDANGRVVASVADYAAVHELVADVIAEGVQATVTPEIKATVAAINALTSSGAGTVTVTALARELELDTSTASRRVKRAIEMGHVRNLEDGRGRPACLVAGEPLPEERALLPHPRELRDPCTVARLREGDHAPSPPLPGRVTVVEEGGPLRWPTQTSPGPGGPRRSVESRPERWLGCPSSCPQKS